MDYHYAARTLRLRASMESRRLEIPPTSGADPTADDDDESVRALWQSGQTRTELSARPSSVEDEC